MAAASKSNTGLRIVDGQLDFSGGIDSGKPTTIQTPAQPFGIPRNMLAWLTNATVRGGGILTRTGWNLIAEIDPAQHQGGFVYRPISDPPYEILSIGGIIYRVNTFTDGAVVNLSAMFGLTNPPTNERCWFCQGKKWLIIQAGDGVTLPLIWDGATLRRSKGITNTGVAPGTPGVNEIPAATAMVYWRGRIWYARNDTINAGDIIGSNSGTAGEKFFDAILNVTENPTVVGGDGFSVPSESGTIRALAFSNNIDSTLGEGPLYIFTAEQIFQLTVPDTRADWIALSAANPPKMIPAQIEWGTMSDWSVVHSNSDLYYHTLLPGIQSLILAIRYFQQFGNTPISSNMNRVMEIEDRALLHMASGISFDNRLWQTILPVQTAVGVAFQGIGILDFDIVSGFQEKLAGTAIPAWEGMYEPGLTLQVLEGKFGGLSRAFVTMLSQKDGKIQIWEATKFQKVDFGDKRVEWFLETPAYNWNSPFDLKEFDNAEIWIDKLFGTVDITAEFREDANPCWHPWTIRQLCTARNPGELGQPEPGYPTIVYCESGAIPVVFEKAPGHDCNDQNGRPANIGCQFQIRLTIKGWCRIRGIRVFAVPRDRRPYEGLSCP